MNGFAPHPPMNARVGAAEKQLAHESRGLRAGHSGQGSKTVRSKVDAGSCYSLAGRHPQGFVAPAGWGCAALA